MNVWAPGAQFCYLRCAVSSLATYVLLIYLLYLTAASQQRVDQPTHIYPILLLAPIHSSVWCLDNIVIWFNLVCLAFTQAMPKTISYVNVLCISTSKKEIFFLRCFGWGIFQLHILYGLPLIEASFMTTVWMAPFPSSSTSTAGFLPCC